MVSWVWIIPAFLLGGMFGILIMAMIAAGNNNRYDD